MPVACVRVALLSVSLCFVLLCPAALAQELTPSMRQDVLRLMEVMGAKELILQYAKQNIGLVKKIRPDIPADKLPVIEKELSAFVGEKISAPGGLAEQVLPIFAKHFSQQEVRELAAFYATPTGQKLLTVMPQAMKESRDAAQHLGISLIPELSRRVNEVLRREAEAGKAAQQ